MPQGFSWAELGVDASRVFTANDAALGEGRDFVLYWCAVQHRAEHNHALAAAIALGNHLKLPVVCYQALRPDYPYASDRLHGAILEGLPDLTADLEHLGIPHWLELPRTRAEHKPRIKELGKRAAAVVTDWFPTFIFPHQLSSAARALDVPLFAVDTCCLVPAQRIPDRQVAAYAIRSKLHKLWPEYLVRPPIVRGPKHARELKAPFELSDAEAARGALDTFDIDHSVLPVEVYPGGRKEALSRLRRFVHGPLKDYAEARNDPAADVNAWLSPALHFGWLFTGEIAHQAILALGRDHPSVQGLLEELLVRRELSFNYCLHTPPQAQLSPESLPHWAQATLADHAQDKRPHYTEDALEQGNTDDEVWNAAQRQLLQEGRIHNYLRMLWGKKLLEWSRTPKEALSRIARLNDRYALDGRDPVSVANFMWILGLHDRPFPERPIFGKVRSMSSARTAKKFDLSPYLARFGGSSQSSLDL
jgi:deoxyribodipyrimidine photo-lyase